MADERTFTCAFCLGTFVAGWSKEEAEAEYRALFPDSAASQAAREVVCDDCHKMMLSELPADQFEAEERVLRAGRESGETITLFESLPRSALRSLLVSLLVDGEAALALGRQPEPRGILSTPEAIEPWPTVFRDRPRKHERRGVIPPQALRGRRLH